jgi:hypothetical protein
VLAAMVGIFNEFKLSDKNQALSLPEGSVRAVIALSLIIIFSIMALFLYTRLENSIVTYKYTGISQQQLNAIPADQILSIEAKETGKGSKVYDVDRRVAKNPTSDDFAKQVLTIVANLLFAIVGFYFGTRAALQVPGSEQPSENGASHSGKKNDQPEKGKPGESQPT